MDDLSETKKLKILMICPWGCACGIYTYTQNLTQELERQGTAVEIYPNTKDFSGLVKLARDNLADVVHIQHEYGISFTMDALMSIIGKFQMAGTPVVLTLHTEDAGANVMLDGVPAAIVLHNDQQNLHLKHTFSKFCKVPHGIPEITFKESKAFYRRKYNIPEQAFVIGTCGFMSADRGQLLETLLQQLAPHIKTHSDIYLHLVMSAHRTDPGGQFANVIKSSLMTYAANQGFGSQIYVNTEFIPTDEFRERIYTFDVGFAYAKPQVVSNSGAAADIISCGVPVVVNDVAHFSHVKPYCSVVPGEIQDVAKRLTDIYDRHSAHTAYSADLVKDSAYSADSSTDLPSLIAKARQAITDLGYSKVATHHNLLYRSLIKNHNRLRTVREVSKTANFGVLNKERYVSITVPNSMWQILLIWTKVQRLIAEGYRIQLMVQNDGMTDINLLRYVLDGLVDVQYADVGLRQDSRLVRLQSYSLAQNMTVDAENWLSSDRSFEDLLGFLNPPATYGLKLGDYATRTASTLITGATTVICASDAVCQALRADTRSLYNLHDRQLLIVGTPLSETWVYEIQHKLKTLGLDSKICIEDVRTTWATCEVADTVITEWGACAVVATMGGSHVVLVNARSWQTAVAAALAKIVNPYSSKLTVAL